MRNKNLITKGSTHVKDSATILKTPNAFDVSTAAVSKNGRGGWSDFEAFYNESGYVAPKQSERKTHEALRKAKRVLGRRVALIAA